jgi:Cyclin
MRILKYAPCGSECFLAVVIYLRRMCKLTRLIIPPHELPPERAAQVLDTEDSWESAEADSIHALKLNAFNIHRLLITGIMVSVKFMSDVFYTNSHVSRIYD